MLSTNDAEDVPGAGCRLSLAESGQQALGLSEELERVRAVFEEEELARENFHAEREQNKRRIEALERAVATEHKEVDRMKTRIEGVQKENRAPPHSTPAAALFYLPSRKIFVLHCHPGRLYSNTLTKCCFCASGICRLDMESNQRKAREATEACDAAQKEVAALQKVVKKKEQELVQKDEDFHEQCATPFCFCPSPPSCL